MASDDRSFDPTAAAAAGALGARLLSEGRYEEGFALWEGRHAAPRLAKPKLAWPEWRGEPLAGKRLVVWPEQGLGDQIMFARFAPLLQRQGVDVTVLCLPPLQRLLAGCLGVRVLAATGAVSFPDPDYWVMTCSLAGRMGVTVESIPAAPYLRALGPGPGLPEGFKVGLVTSGSPAHGNDAQRSLPPQEAARLRAMAAQVVPLDPANTGARDFADTAAIVEQLDLVVTVDTAAAHLAGAMGKPCWVLVPAVGTDWRWLQARSDSPWYPSVRLYRQPRAGAWDEVADRVLADVRDRAL